MYYKGEVVIIFLWLAMVSGRSFAVDMTFKGILVTPPPCSINNDKPIIVDFGRNIGVSKVDGRNYRQEVDYQLVCEPNSSTEGLSLLLTTNTPADFDNATVQTSIAGLGIRLLVDSAPVVFGKPLPIDANNPPILEAVPVKQPDTNLSEGDFFAAATLQAIYQ